MGGDVESRIYLRHQFIACGLNSIFLKIKTWAPDEFKDIFLHINQIEEWSQSDLEEFKSSFELLDDMDDPKNLVQATIQRLENEDSGNYAYSSESTEHYTSIIRHLMIVVHAINGPERHRYLAFVDNLIAQIAMSGKGIIPDFYDNYGVSIQSIIENTSNPDQQLDILSELRYYKEKCIKFENQSEYNMTTAPNINHSNVMVGNESIKQILSEIEISQLCFVQELNDCSNVRLLILSNY